MKREGKKEKFSNNGTLFAWHQLSRRWAIQLVISLISCAIMPQDVWFFFFHSRAPLQGPFSKVDSGSLFL